MRIEADPERYLEFTRVVDGGHEAVQACARELTRGLASDVDRARRIFEWVRDAIPHSHDIDVDVVPCSASEVLAERTGICYAKSHLFAALCRVAGIPAGFCYQVYVADPESGRTAIHALNAVWLQSVERWIRLDARGNTGVIDAQFAVDEEKLAFPVDPSKGELFIYERVFSRPAPEVVEALLRFRSRRELWKNLPEALPDAALGEEDRVLNATLPRRDRLSTNSQ